MVPTVYALKKALGRPYSSRTKDVVRLVSIEGIDFTVTGTTVLMNTPVGVDIVITEAFIHCTAAVDIASPATAGIGIAAGEDDVYSSQPLLDLAFQTDVFRFPPAGAAVIASNGDIVKLGIDAAATGTSQMCRVELFGYQV